MSIAAIIPAFNEEQTIKNVLEVVKTVDLIDRIVVVSDGSSDSTAAISRQCGAEVIELTENVGKGGAMNTGMKYCGEDIVVFLDADLLGLKKQHIESLLKPILDNTAYMTIGLFSKGRVGTDLAQKVAPFLSGQRAIKKHLFDSILDIDISRFGVEMALTKYVNKNKVPVVEVILNDLTHVTKEEKLGLVKGFSARLKMYWEIAKSLKAVK